LGRAARETEALRQLAAYLTARNRMPLWKRLILISAAFGGAFAVVASSIVGLAVWYKSRPRPWNSSALKASFYTVEIQTQPQSESYLAEFLYDVHNNTDTNYQVQANELTVMAVLTEGNVLSKDFGHYQTADAILEGPPFIPAQGKARITIRISYQYPSEFAEADKNDIKKVGHSLDYRLKELSGFVLFDQANHYRIDLPERWKSWDDVKSK
jgi:hypothetical protein